MLGSKLSFEIDLPGMNYMGLLSSLKEYPQDRMGWPWNTETDTLIYSRETNWPKISIITPSYNQGRFIEETIRSVLLQNYPNLEYIIIDGGSTDKTVDIIKRYEKWITYWVSEKDNGQSEAINKGFEMATGEVLAWLNSDDWYEANGLYEIGKLFNKGFIQVVNGDCRFHYENSPGRDFTLRYGKVNEGRLLCYWSKLHWASPPQPSVFFSRGALQRVGSLNAEMNYSMDYDLWLRLIRFYNFTYLPKVISNFRLHNDSKSVSENEVEKFYPECYQSYLSALSYFPLFKRLKYRLKYLTRKVHLLIPYYISLRSRIWPKRRL